jgi:hypothetical protein
VTEKGGETVSFFIPPGPLRTSFFRLVKQSRFSPQICLCELVFSFPRQSRFFRMRRLLWGLRPLATAEKLAGLLRL